MHQSFSSLLVHSLCKSRKKTLLVEVNGNPNVNRDELCWFVLYNVMLLLE